MFSRFGRLAYRRRRLVVVAWLLVAIVAGVFGTGVFGRTSSDLDGGADSESVVAADRLIDAETTRSDERTGM